MKLLNLILDTFSGVPAIYPPSIPYQPFYQYYSVPMVTTEANNNLNNFFLNAHLTCFRMCPPFGLRTIKVMYLIEII